MTTIAGVGHALTPAEPTLEQVEADTRRALAHITGRTRQGKFACRFWDWSAERWEAAIDPLLKDGSIEWVTGQVADDPTVLGGYVLTESSDA